MSIHLMNLSKQRGVAAIEFALIAPIFFILLIGVMELGRVLFYTNAAAEATRLGARVAVVCDMDAAGIRSQMISRLHILEPENIEIRYTGSDPTEECEPETCRFVTVSIQALQVGTVIPLTLANPSSPGFSIGMPPFTTTLPRESLRTEIGGDVNPLCTT